MYIVLGFSITEEYFLAFFVFSVYFVFQQGLARLQKSAYVLLLLISRVSISVKGLQGFPAANELQCTRSV